MILLNAFEQSTWGSLQIVVYPMARDATFLEIFYFQEFSVKSHIMSVQSAEKKCFQEFLEPLCGISEWLIQPNKPLTKSLETYFPDQFHIYLRPACMIN